MKALSDPIIERIRSTRMKLSAECDHDLHRLAAMGRRSYDQWIARQQKQRQTGGTTGSAK